MNRVEHTVSCFKEGFSCSQALLLTYGVQFGLSREMASTVENGEDSFGGGLED
ncbi:MAG: hypothetical protein K8R25_10490 [Methanosarcinales archaeon]|nr:hypothetical protein [Methanosarcinales archaeon]